MDTVDMMYSILAGMALIGIFIYLALPVLRGHSQTVFFFKSGASRESGAYQLQQRLLLESIRDLQIEKELGKLSFAEYQSHLQPLQKRLAALEESPESSAPPRTRVAGNRLGWFCPDCGNLNHYAYESQASPDKAKRAHCGQCGGIFEYIQK